MTVEGRRKLTWVQETLGTFFRAETLHTLVLLCATLPNGHIEQDRSAPADSNH